MRLLNWDRYELRYRRVVGFASVCGAALGTLVYVVTRESLGGLAIAFSVLSALGAAYTVLSAPRRATERAALNQAREAPSLASAVTVHLKTMRSRNRTLLMMRAEDGELSLLLKEVRRLILLGVEPARALREVNTKIPASSVRRILAHVAERTETGIDEEGTEYGGILKHSMEMEETKTPIFIAVAFFAPIMFVLFSAISRNASPSTVFAMIFLELVVLNLVFSFASTDKGGAGD